MSSGEIGRAGHEGRYVYFVAALIGAVTLARLLFIGMSSLSLAPDEAHYWEWSRRPGLSYYSKGPMVAYIIFLFTGLLGTSEFTVRLGAVLLSAGSLIISYLLAVELLGSRKAGFFAVLTLAILPLSSAGAVLMTIDAPFIFFWLATAFICAKALKRPDSIVLWLLAGLSLGLGFLSKYSILLFIPSLLLYLALARGGRAITLKPGPYLAVAVAAAVASPVFMWNWAHGWVGLKHVAGLTGGRKAGEFTIRYVAQFVGSQAGVISPIIFGLLIYGGVVAWARGTWERARSGGMAPFLYLACLGSFTLIVFFLLSLVSKVQANWAAAAYPALAIALAGKLVAASLRSKGIIPLFVAGVAVALAMDVVGHSPGLLYRLAPGMTGRSDPLSRLRGWRELGEEVGKIVRSQPGEPPFIFSDRYQVASELAFYIPDRPLVYNVNLGRRMNQYDIWDGTEALKGRSGIYVRLGSHDVEPGVAASFERCGRLATVQVAKGPRDASPYSVFRCDGFNGFLSYGGPAKY